MKTITKKNLNALRKAVHTILAILFIFALMSSCKMYHSNVLFVSQTVVFGCFILSMFGIGFFVSKLMEE